MWVQGHGLYSRQVRGLVEGWIVIWVRRYLCVKCGRTMICLQDWLHPWRWYAATVIIEALYRYLILQETVRDISHRFGRSADEWRTLRRWQKQLLVSPTLWGWLRSRLGISQPAQTRRQGGLHLSRLLGEMGVAWESATQVLAGLEAGVRATLCGMLHNRQRPWPITQFHPGVAWAAGSGAKPTVTPTEDEPGRGPPR